MDDGALELINGWAMVGHLSYVLLICSVAMRSMLPLRLLAIASGVLGVAYSAVYMHDWVSTFWEGSFVAVNATWVGVLVYQRATQSLSDEETMLRSGAFAELNYDQFRAVLAIASWRDLDVGDVLATQGRMITELVLLVDGRVEIEIDGNVVAFCREGDFVGEISVLSNAPATATATVTAAGRCLSFKRYELRRLLNGRPDLERALGRVFTNNLIEKLVATSAGV